MANVNYSAENTVNCHPCRKAHTLVGISDNK